MTMNFFSKSKLHALFPRPTIRYLKVHVYKTCISTEHNILYITQVQNKCLFSNTITTYDAEQFKMASINASFVNIMLV